MELCVYLVLANKVLMKIEFKKCCGYRAGTGPQRTSLKSW